MIESLVIGWSFQILSAGVILFLTQFVIPIAVYKLAGQLLGIFLIGSGLYFQGVNSERKEWESKMAEARLEIAAAEAKAQEINVQVLTEFIPRVQYIDRIEQQVVTEFVTVKDDSACTINNGFVRLHDQIAAQIKIQPEDTDKDPSPIKLSQVGETVKFNYQACRRNALQLELLQKWVLEQKKLWDEKK